MQGGDAQKYRYQPRQKVRVVAGTQDWLGHAASSLTDKKLCNNGNLPEAELTEGKCTEPEVLQRHVADFDVSWLRLPNVGV